MKRHLCITVLSALVLVPDWASACWPRSGMPAYERAYYAPVYRRAPVYYAAPMYCPPPVYVQPCVPVMPPVLQPPRVGVPKAKAGSALTEPARPIARPDPAPARPPVVEPLRPAAGVAVPPAPTPNEPKRGGLFEIPKNLTPDAKLPKNPDTIPVPNLPLGLGAEPKLPSLELPKVVDPKLPSLDLPTGPGAGPKLPSLDLPGASAVPVPAPPPPDALIPKVPDALPPLTLPPDTPVAPPKAVEVKSSPLTAAARALKVSVFPAAGAATATGLRKVGFYNHTGRDLALTIEGKAVTLPAMSYLHAQLPPTFVWTCADAPAARATVPADAAGVDVLIRE